MSKIKIENPKVFISYAWSSKEYENKVLSFATELVSNGVDVILDKWSLKEGNDTYAFMEQSVNDTTVTNVLLMLDPQYEMKANDRKGGVGTETQIISAEIYNKVKQDKFLPIVFEKHEDGSIPKPTYLKGLLHFDLSAEERYDEEYQRLVKTLYGVEIFKKPELGKKPIWVEESVSVTTKIRTTYDVLKSNLPEKVKREKFILFLDDIKTQIISFKQQQRLGSILLTNYLDLYMETLELRDQFLNLLQYVSYVPEGEKSIAATFEELCEELKSSSGTISEIKQTLLHELFIYVIAIYYKQKNYSAIAYTLTKTYFVRNLYEGKAESFTVFYHHDQNLDNAVNKRDDKNYYSGTACHWMNTINTEVCSEKDFVFADILCHNVSVFDEQQLGRWYWFPLTYIYEKNGTGSMRAFASKLQSREHLNESICMFGYDSIEKFKEKFRSVEKLYQDGTLQGYRHRDCFEEAPLLCNYLKSTELGVLK